LGTGSAGHPPVGGDGWASLHRRSRFAIAEVPYTFEATRAPTTVGLEETNDQDATCGSVSTVRGDQHDAAGRPGRGRRQEWQAPVRRRSPAADPVGDQESLRALLRVPGQAAQS